LSRDFKATAGHCHCDNALLGEQQRLRIARVIASLVSPLREPSSDPLLSL